MTSLFFGLFAGITVFSALAVAWQKNLLNSAFLLLATFLGVAALFLFAGAEFLAVTQILIYVGGILTLLLFGILITKRRELRFLSSGIQNNKSALLIAVSLFCLLVYIVHSEKSWFVSKPSLSGTSTLLGYGILSNYLLPFELMGLLLLVVLIGILVLASSFKER